MSFPEYLVGALGGLFGPTGLATLASIAGALVMAVIIFVAVHIGAVLDVEGLNGWNFLLVPLTIALLVLTLLFTTWLTTEVILA